MKGFEKYLTKMFENMQFRKVSSAFFLKLGEGIKNIKFSKKMFISPDKTCNFYETKKEDHEKLQNNKFLVTKEDQYKSEKDFDVDDKLNSIAKQQCFVIIKDHEPSLNNPKYRFLDPTESELGKLDKHYLANNKQKSEIK